MQEMQDMQEMQKVQEIQEMQEMQEMQDMQDMQECRKSTITPICICRFAANESRCILMLLFSSGTISQLVS